VARLTWHGHACFTLVADDGSVLLLDPFLDDNPKADIRAGQVEAVDFVLCSHGHGDHFSDAIPIARRTGATLVGTFELVEFARTRGVEHVHAMNIGGGHHFPFGYLKLTPALHTGSVHGDATGRYTGAPAGFWIHLRPAPGGTGGTRVYFAGDTALTMDMQLLRGRVDVAILPIGDNYTMGPEDAVRAVEMIAPTTVVPMHYDTWDVIAQDAQAFARRVGGLAAVRVLVPGGSFDF
jgi:L-ascorbate metabolism protein UlaG (beta-lactamase superfamily)